MNGIQFVDRLTQDLRVAVRALRAAPLVCAIAIVSFTVGIGANSAVFSIVNAVLLKPLPYPDPDRLVLLGYTFAGASVPLVSETKLNVWKDEAVALQDIAALRARRVAVTAGDRAEQLLALQTNSDFFALFGARAAVGRVFTAAEDRPGGDRVVLLSDGFWKRRFGSDPHIVGRPLRVDGAVATIVGVLGGNVDTTIFNVAPDVWIPLQLDPNSTDHPPSLIAVARLRPDATMALAQARARLAGNEFRRRFSQASGPQDTFTIAPFQDALVQDIRPSLLVLLGAVAFVFDLVCQRRESDADSRISPAAGDRDPHGNRSEPVADCSPAGDRKSDAGVRWRRPWIGVRRGRCSHASCVEPCRSTADWTGCGRRDRRLAGCSVHVRDLRDDGSRLRRVAGNAFGDWRSADPCRERGALRRHGSGAPRSRIIGGQSDGSGAGAAGGSDLADSHLCLVEPGRSRLRR